MSALEAYHKKLEQTDYGKTSFLLTILLDDVKFMSSCFASRNLAFRQLGSEKVYYVEQYPNLFMRTFFNRKMKKYWSNVYGDLEDKQYKVPELRCNREFRVLHFILANTREKVQSFSLEDWPEADETIHWKNGFWRSDGGPYIEIDTSIFVGANAKGRSKAELVADKEYDYGLRQFINSRRVRELIPE